MLQMPHSRSLCISLLLVLVISTCAHGQSTASDVAYLQKQIEALQAEQKVLEGDLLLIKNMLLGKQVNTSAPPLQDMTI